MTEGAPRYRTPWFWLPIVAAAAVIATVVLLGSARARIEQNNGQFAAGQMARLQGMETRIDDYFGKATQLVATGAAELAPIHDDPATAERLVAELYNSRRTSQIHDLGSSYEPGAFNGDHGLFCVYAAPGPEGHMELFYYNPRSRAYTTTHWYQRAMKAGPSQTVFDGPYFAGGVSYISTMLAFARDGRLAGVVTVDMLTSTFIDEDLIPALRSGDIAWIESSTRGRKLLVTAPIPNDGDRVDRALPLRYTGAYLHLSTDAAPLHAANRATESTSMLAGVAIWLFAALVAVGLVQLWKGRERASALELERGRLESEIAIGKKVEAELRKAALTDGLTSLPNRSAFLQRAAEIIAHPEDGEYAVFLIDLDRFNIVNETLGHLAGDELLKMIAARLHSGLPREAWIARLGGDEFVVIAPVDPPPASTFAEHLLASLHEPVLLGGRLIYSAASVGVVPIVAGYRRPVELLRDADIATYAAKSRGRACYSIFDSAMRSQVAAQSDLENDLRRAIRRHEFLPYYQPIVDIRTHEPVAFEALVRWDRDERGVVEAAAFIGHAERCGLVDAIDDSMFVDVCIDSAKLFDRFPSASVAVNVSAAHLTTPGLTETIENVLRSHAVPPERLTLEITETAIMSDANRAQATLQALRETGLRIVIDDFGAGHSSLAYVHRLPISGLKIDRSFVAPLAHDTHALAIVRSVVALADTLGLDTVAEGVENAEQLEALRELGVVHAQGFFFSPALPLEKVLNGVRESSA